MPRGLRPEDREIESEMASAPWTAEETAALHEMVQEYMWTKTLRKKAKWFIVWFLGLPGVVLAFWEPMDKLFRLLARKFGS
jgi:hypothetical protein